MSRTSLFGFVAAAGLSAGLVMGGCRENGGSNNGDNDMSVSQGDMKKGDGGGGGTDMPVFDNYQEGTPHDIDVGDIQKFETVKLLGMVVTTPVLFFKADSGTKCQYEIWVQDPACSTEAAAPCGIVVLDPTKYDMDQGNCPFPDESSSLLKSIQIGDNVDVFGVVDTFPDQQPAAGKPAVVQHELEVQKITKTAGTATVTPIVLTADADVARFVNKTGDGFAKFEGTVVKLQPASGKLHITQIPDFSTTFNNRLGLSATFSATNDANLSTSFANSSSGYLNRVDGGNEKFPVLNQQFTSVAGVINNLFGGSFMPIKRTDWVE